VQSIHAEEITKHQAEGAHILDVRKPGEWSTSHLKDAAFLPLADFPKNLEGLNKEATYVVHCAGGYRSMTAVSIMKNHGFKNLMNVYGGFGAITKTDCEVVTEEVVI
jgi:rhodanese-related sulfurtransferase